MGERIMKVIRYTVAAAATALGMVVGQAPAAHADQWDYVSFLDNNGVSYSTVSGVIDLGKETCHHLRGGGDYRQVMSILTGPLDYTRAEGAAIIAASVTYMCPDAESVIQQQLGNSSPNSTTSRVA